MTKQWVSCSVTASLPCLKDLTWIGLVFLSLPQVQIIERIWLRIIKKPTTHIRNTRHSVPITPQTNTQHELSKIILHATSNAKRKSVWSKTRPVYNNSLVLPSASVPLSPLSISFHFLFWPSCVAHFSSCETQSGIPWIQPNLKVSQVHIILAITYKL